MWGAATNEIRAAWDDAAAQLRDPAQPIVGILSDPGPYQKLTLIPRVERIVVKVALGSRSGALIERERAVLHAIRRTPFNRIAPEVFGDADGRSARVTLVMERIDGEHPRWDDCRVHRELLDALAWDREYDTDPLAARGLHHGDVAPWNAIRAPTGVLMLVDWDGADLGCESPPLCGALDFVLRGGIAARARQARIGARVHALLRAAGVGSRDLDSVISAFQAYRAVARHLAFGRPDALGSTAERLLIECLSP
jgi:aminoglycoside phosphotransferase (APT) family kinase protein